MFAIPIFTLACISGLVVRTELCEIAVRETFPIALFFEMKQRPPPEAGHYRVPQMQPASLAGVDDRASARDPTLDCIDNFLRVGEAAG